ncbi:hypothetical protein EA462_11730 [Natrarchaeobius halalkaliphilus]|uniref:Uncharacterized protein n=1 Tax=Natrarchaeobius halalkaliphilus TaxID=1679091 RepID=A0A3N6LJU8_9EURY|nr:hypothetical protein [Natrarchaeobius halalkaliphilus]RQG89043.1 hypothetical protein EA462_11730 [Natrarchaeobius halalkaliphilus]
MNRAPSRLGLLVVTLVAGASVAVGATFAFRPALAHELFALEALVALVDPATLLLVAVLALALFAPTIGISGKLRASSTDPLVEAADSSAASRVDRDSDARRSPIVGASIDGDVERATDYDGRSHEVRSKARTQVIDSLRPIATRAYATSRGHSTDDAAAAIEDGSWTDDPRAAALLASESGPSTPVWIWLFDLVSGVDPFVRSLEHTIDEIDAIQSTPPERPRTPREESGGEAA